ncbi:fungal-specific transcription factor domain-domain-containing protein [Naematelia encephala]|uniref:Fungal-specific transcription factor domain-domain-containing protein n=1 Tax=Naematelia encephala TaxID=71784 RepID=A0A1Y2APU2_9TREE|nr:fungal-specific transcription factor domain-domain-containing protein [Naematelia encephala]
MMNVPKLINETDWQQVALLAFQAGRATAKESKITRSRRGCLTCRARKVKCSEDGACCSQCKRAKRKCQWPEGHNWHTNPHSTLSNQSEESHPPVKRSRVTLAGNSLQVATVGNPIHAGPSISNEQRVSGPLIRLPSFLEASTRDSEASTPLAQAETNPFHLDNDVQAEIPLAGSSTMVPARIASPTPRLTIAEFDVNATFDQLVEQFLASLQASQPLMTSDSTTSNNPVGQSNAIDHMMSRFGDDALRELIQFFKQETMLIVTIIKTSQRPEHRFVHHSMSLTLLDEQSSTCYALRQAFLSVGAAHKEFLLARSSSSVPNKNVMDSAAFKRAALRSYWSAIETESEFIDQHPEIILAIFNFLLFRDMIACDRQWRRVIHLAVDEVQRRGGPKKLIERHPDSPILALQLEMLAIVEVFGAFTTGCDPILLEPWAPWWLEPPYPSESIASRRWDNVEHCSGMSRTMFELVARIVRLANRASLTGLRSSSGPDMDEVRVAANNLWMELIVSETSSVGTVRPRRVQYGDLIYCTTMKLFILSEVHPLDVTAETREKLVTSLIELCADTSEEPGALAWPLLVLSRAVNRHQRSDVLRLHYAFSLSYAGGMVIVSQIIFRQWAEDDEGKSRRSWSQFLQDISAACLVM